VRYGNITLVRTEADRDEWRARLADGKWLQEQCIAFSVDDITPTPELAAEPAYQTLRSEFTAKNDGLAQRVLRVPKILITPFPEILITFP